ncbi:MAG: MFS transporter [Clostridia bacterium]|nr:MFS transporter [Clostridia bacterium]
MDISLSKKQIDCGARRMFLLCVLAYTAIYVGRKNFSVCLSAMISEGFIDKVTGGAAGTAFLVVYAVGQFINGLISDRVSPSSMITAGLLGAGVANISMAFNQFSSLVPCIWCICGIFCSMLWSSVIKCIAQWLPSERVERAGVKLSVTVPLGSVITYLIATLSLRFSGWRTVFLTCGLVCILSGTVFMISIKRMSGYIRYISDNGGESGKISNVQVSGKKRMGSGLFALIFSSEMLLIIAAVMCNGVLKDGLDLWTPTFISEYFEVSAAFTALLMSLIPLLNVAGAYLSEFFYSKMHLDEMSVTAVMYGLTILCFIPVCIFTAAGETGALLRWISVILLAFIMMATTGANTMLMTFIPLRYKRIGKVSSISGMLNAFSYAGAACSGITVGLVSEYGGWSVTILSFAVISILGAVISVLCIRFWRGKMQTL